MNKKSILSVIIFLSLSAAISINTVNSQPAQTFVLMPSVAVNNVIYSPVGALEIVANPTKYLNKNVKIVAKFDKFSTLGLDYPPAMRSSENYISFLIQRPDVTNHNIPLSELKIFLKKEVAEKNINLDVGDEIEFNGKVFSNALGDAWIDVDSIKVLTKKNPAKKEEKSID